MINHYTAERRIRSDDAYTPGNVAGKRPDRATVVYTQRIKEAYKGIPVVLGGIEASLRRFAHYDYWSDTVKNSVLPDSKADILVYGNGERPIIEIAWRLSQGEDIKSLTDIRGTASPRASPASMPGSPRPESPSRPGKTLTATYAPGTTGLRRLRSSPSPNPSPHPRTRLRLYPRLHPRIRPQHRLSPQRFPRFLPPHLKTYHHLRHHPYHRPQP